MSDRKVAVPRPLSRGWIANAVPYGWQRSDLKDIGQQQEEDLDAF